MGWEDRAYHREGPSGQGPRLIFPMPTKLTFALILSCILVFVIQATTGPVAGFSSLVRWGELIFRGGAAFTQPWRWITYQYLHGTGNHIFWNMLAIYFFVPALERLWGWKKVLAFYTLGGIAAGVTYGFMCLIL
jgi:membrane associated rhomboid family serine protease